MDHFERVSAVRYEVESEAIEEVVIKAKDLREEANEMMNVEPEKEEIDRTISEIRDSAPEEDEIKISYIKGACEGVRNRVVEMVRFMFRNRADAVSYTHLTLPTKRIV